LGIQGSLASLAFQSEDIFSNRMLSGRPLSSDLVGHEAACSHSEDIER